MVVVLIYHVRPCSLCLTFSCFPFQISEFEDAFKDRQRTSGLSAYSFRRNEYGSSPPTRGDVAGYSRPIHGRWEGRSTGRSDRDSDSQSDKDSGTVLLIC